MSVYTLTIMDGGAEPRKTGIDRAQAKCVCFNLRRAARAVTQLYDEALRPSGLRATQLSVLSAVALLGPVTMTRLAELLVMERTTLTRNLRLLVEKELVRVAPGEDRRSRSARLTGRGRDALARALPLWKRAQTRIVEGLGRERWDDLLKGLTAAVAVAQAPRPAGEDIARP